MNEMILVEIMVKGTTINYEMYTASLQRLKRNMKLDDERRK
jgi:hypothetical protein